MAKPKKQASATPKKRSTKYSKLAAVCSKELAAKKKALVLAEKRLAKAQKTHSELLAEVARLDMLERSLKAVNEGLEPPQNVRYVYTYPHWVYNPYGWGWNGNGYTITLGNAQTQTFNNLGGGSLYTNATPVNLTTTGTNCINTVTSTAGLSSSVNSGYSTAFNSGSALVGNNSGISLPSDAPTWQTVTTTADFTVDLSTGATEEEPQAETAEAAEVGNGD